jgi:hypothetical protein
MGKEQETENGIFREGKGQETENGLFRDGKDGDRERLIQGRNAGDGECLHSGKRIGQEKENDLFKEDYGQTTGSLLFGIYKKTHGWEKTERLILSTCKVKGTGDREHLILGGERTGGREHNILGRERKGDRERHIPVGKITGHREHIIPEGERTGDRERNIPGRERTGDRERIIPGGERQETED